MIIHYSSTFGFENIYPRLLQKPGDAIAGELYLGKKGLLEFLELHLGLPYSDVSDLLRIRLYENAVQKTIEVHPDLYCAKSFATDPWNTARQLLLWRDELVMTLWDFKATPDHSDRLYAIAEIEKNITELPKGINDRWKAVYHAYLRTPIRNFKVYESEEVIHPFFLLLFEKFKQTGVSVEYTSPYFDNIEPTTDLEFFKKKLLFPTEVERREPQNDGSIQILTAQNDLLLADALDAEGLLIIPSRGSVLENAMIRKGLPALGYTEQYTDSAILGLLEMMTLFLWEPLNSEKLLEFLTTRVAPMRLEFRKKLAAVYAQKPGFENADWKKVLEENPEEAENYSRWFSRKRFSPSGAPAQAVISLYEDFLTWIRGRISQYSFSPQTEKKIPFEELEKQTLLLIKLCHQEKTISPIMLGRWIKELMAETSYFRLQPQEIGALPYVTHPGNVNSSIDAITWWNFTDEGNPLSSAFIPTPGERELLQTCAVHEPTKILDQWYNAQIKAILFTEKKLTLCIPEKIGGEEIPPHPLLSDLNATFKDLKKLYRQDLPRENRTLLELPVKREFVHFQWPENNVQERESSESFSSVSKLLTYPFEYFLEYILNIRPIEPPQLKIDQKLKGTLLHQVAKNLYEDMDTTRIRDEMEKVIREEGEVLNLSKHQLAKAEFLNLGTSTLENLLNKIKENGWKFHEAEKKYEKEGFLGFIDLVLEKRNEIAILDLKFGGLNTRKTEMQKGQELQLMMYYHLFGKADYIGYYILGNRKFIMHNNRAISDALATNPNLDLSGHFNNYWNTLLEVIRQRKEQMAKGELEMGIGFDFGVLNDQNIWEKLDLVVARPEDKKVKIIGKFSKFKTLMGQ